jgi:hypothetical protein
MLVPDVLHEIELGVWKALFTHLMRIIQDDDINQIAELDSRYVYVLISRRTLQ